MTHRHQMDQRDRDVTDTWQLPHERAVADGSRNVGGSSLRQSTRRPAPRDQWEQRAWISCYRNIGDPLIAAEVIRLLDADGAIRAERLGLYLQAKRSLRRHKQRQAQQVRIASALHWLGHGLLVVPVTVPAMLLWRTLQFLGHVLLACLPAHTSEPAEQRLQDLGNRTDTASPGQAVNGDKPVSGKSCRTRSSKVKAASGT